MSESWLADVIIPVFSYSFVNDRMNCQHFSDETLQFCFHFIRSAFYTPPDVAYE